MVVGHQTTLERNKADFWGEKGCLPGCGVFRGGLFTVGFSRHESVIAESETGPTAMSASVVTATQTAS